MNVTCWTVTKDLWNAKFNFCRNSSFNVVCKYSNISLANIQISQALILFVNIQISRGRGVYISQTKSPSSWQTVMKLILAVKFSPIGGELQEQRNENNFKISCCFSAKSKRNPLHMIRNQNPIISLQFARTTR